MSDPAPDPEAAGGRTPWLLFAGAALGLALATGGLLEIRSEQATLSADVIARIGERSIRRVDYERVLAGVEGDLRGPVDESVRRRVLDRMIDEELLVQRALELGLAAIDRRVRGELTSGLMDSIVSEADADEATDAEIKLHFEENVDFFSRPGRLRARTVFFSARGDDRREGGPARQRAVLALGRLRAGEPAGEVSADLGDAQISPLPTAMLPPSKIRDYVGPMILQAIEGLAVGAWSEPIESASGFYVAGLVDREPRIVPAFAQVEKLVQQDLKRRRGDAALRRYLDDLRLETTVRVNEPVLSALK